MPVDLHKPVTLIIMASVFGLTLALWLIAILFWYAAKRKRAERLTDRLWGSTDTSNSADARMLRLWKEGQEATILVPTSRRGRLFMVGTIQRSLRRAGVNIPVSAFLLGILGVVTLLFALILILTESVYGALAFSFVFVILVRNHLQKRAEQRLATFESQFAEALEVCGRSLRAGHPLVGAFRIISQEMPRPVSTLFGDICQLQGLGLSLNEALKNVADDSDSPDMKLFAMSVVIQYRSGGNLADMMQRLAAIIRDRIRVKRRVRILTAQVQFSKRIMMVLPFVLLGLLTAINPNYMSPLFYTRTGNMLLAVAAVCAFGGMWIMNRLSRLSY